MSSCYCQNLDGWKWPDEIRKYENVDRKKFIFQKTTSKLLESWKWILKLAFGDFWYLTDSIRFEYDLSIAEHNYEIMPEGQRIIIEFVDDDAKFERAYQLGTDLKLGEHVLNFNIGIPPEELIDLMNGFDRYTINIYTEYGSNRQLIASTNYTYF